MLARRCSRLLLAASSNPARQPASERTFKQRRLRKVAKEPRAESPWYAMPPAVHIDSVEVVDSLLTHLAPEVAQNEQRFLFEACPGKALLTEALLRRTDCTLIVLADRKSDHGKLKVRLLLVMTDDHRISLVNPTANNC